MAARRINTISTAEFAQMMQTARPLSGWSQTLTLANSGGPDSTCLLFLLNRYLKGDDANGSHSDGRPQRLVSLGIDHDLQPTSSQMAQRAAKTAELLGVEHITTKIPWGKTGYYARPGAHDKIEESARTMRYKILFGNMLDLQSNTLAMGHHLDDQIETMLMRLGRGAGLYGLAGMRPCRRWGMGNEFFTGIEGLRRWIVRPLLPISKDRILATCEEHQLEYVTDPTNFQPQFTIRNAIRDVIHGARVHETDPDGSQFSKYPPHIQSQLKAINQAAALDTRIDFDLSSSLEHLRNAHEAISLSVSKAEKEVDDILATQRLASPPGTIAISLNTIISIKSDDVREALLFRMVRYISVVPWGDPKAELGRRKASVTGLIHRVFNITRLGLSINHSICPGSGVLWRPVAVRKGRWGFHFRKVQHDHEHFGWIAMRQPDILTHKGQVPVRLINRDLHVTDAIKSCLAQFKEGADPILEIVYDNRFLVRFQLDKMAQGVSRRLSKGWNILIAMEAPWDTPQILINKDDVTETIHSSVVWTPEDWQTSWERRAPPHHKVQDVRSDWITIEYFRPLSAI